MNCTILVLHYPSEKQQKVQKIIEKMMEASKGLFEFGEGTCPYQGIEDESINKIVEELLENKNNERNR